MVFLLTCFLSFLSPTPQTRILWTPPRPSRTNLNFSKSHGYIGRVIPSYFFIISSYFFIFPSYYFFIFSSYFFICLHIFFIFFHISSYFLHIFLHMSSYFLHIPGTWKNSHLSSYILWALGHGISSSI